MADNNTKIDDLQIDIVVNAGKAATMLDTLATALRDAGRASSALKDVASQLRDMGNAAAGSRTKVRQMGESIDETGESAKKTGSLLKGLIGSMKAWGKGISATFSTFARIAKYRAIRSIIRMITSAFSEGIQNLVEWDAAFGNNTSGALATMTEIKSLANQIKNSLGAMAMPIIQSLLPALRAAAELLMFIANGIQQTVRSILGYSTYMKAVYTEVDYLGDSLGTATGKAKELKRVLFGFDELNVLPSPDTAAGGTGTGLLNSAAPLFVETDIEPFKVRLTKFFQWVADKWSKLGDLIAPAAFWVKDHVVEPVANFFSTLFDNIGKSLSFVWTKAKTTITNIVKFFPDAWDSIKTDAVNNWNTFKERVIDPLVSWFKTAKDTIIGFFPAAWNAITTAAVVAWTAFKGAVIIPVVGWFTGAIATVVGAFTAAWLAIKGILDTVHSFIKDKVIEPVKTGLKTAIETIEINTRKVIKGIADGFSNAVKAVKNGFDAYIVNPVKEFTNFLVTVVRAAIDLILHPSKWGDKGWTEFKDTVSSAWSGMIDNINAKIESTKNVIVDTQSKLSKTPLKVQILADISGMPKSIAYYWGLMQTRLNGNPLQIPTSVGSSTLNTTAIQTRKNSIATAYASGGEPDVGTLFYAGERGAEVVASSNHGTGVMNMDQMRDAVADGNMAVVNAIYALINTVNSKSFDVLLDGNKVGKSVTEYQSNQMRRGIAY